MGTEDGPSPRPSMRSRARWPSAMGGDEFIVVGTPTATGLPGRLAAFRASWPRTFAEAFGDAEIVARRVLTAVVPGRSLVQAGNTLGLEVGAVKGRYAAVDRTGIQVGLGRQGHVSSQACRPSP